MAAGDLFYKEQTPVTITSSGSSVATATASSAGTIDLRASGTANLIENLVAFMELTCRFTTITNIIAGVLVAEAFLVPALDGTNYADVDTTSGASYIPNAYRVGTFTSHKQLVTATDYRFATAPFELFPALYTAYVLFRAGQTVTANWTLKIAAARAQYS